MDALPIDLSWNRATVVELAAHELTVDDAYGVFQNQPEFYVQRPSPEIGRQGAYRQRPERLMMIGPTRSGRMLIFILNCRMSTGCAIS